jgi:abortive infection bacteriophage resistance protein
MAGLLFCGGKVGKDIKPFKNIEEQISILQARGLIIDDLEEARNLLRNLSYYRLSAYTLTLRKNDMFYSNLHFSDVMQIYNFDMELRAALMYVLEYIEVSVRTHIGYHHAEKHGPLGYLDASSFENENRYQKFINDYENSILEYGKKEVFVQHHKDEYDGQFPMWVLVEILSFGALSRLFSNLEKELRDDICKDNYGLIGEDYIKNWLQAFTILRNICAHRGRIYNREIPFGIKLPEKDKKLLKKYGLSMNRVPKQFLGYMFIIRKMVNNDHIWNTFVNRILTLIEKYPFVKISHYGFPDNWKELFGINSLNMHKI